MFRKKLCLGFLSGTAFASFAVLAGCGQVRENDGFDLAGLGNESQQQGATQQQQQGVTQQQQQGATQQQQQGATQQQQQGATQQQQQGATQQQQQGGLTNGCANLTNSFFPQDSRYRVVRQDGFLTAIIRSVGDGYADFTNLYAAFGNWEGTRFNGGYIEEGSFAASRYSFHIVRSDGELLAVLSRDGGADRVIGTVDSFSQQMFPYKVTIRMMPGVCIVQYGDAEGNLVSGGSGWMLLQY